MSHSSAHKISVPVAVVDGQSPWVVALSIWITAGCAVLICFPAMRAIDPFFGWLPFWLVIAPTIDLIVLRHRRLSARAVAWWTRARQHRRRCRSQARRWHQRPTHARTLRRTDSQDDQNR